MVKTAVTRTPEQAQGSSMPKGESSDVRPLGTSEENSVSLQTARRFIGKVTVESDSHSLVSKVAVLMAASASGVGTLVVG
jgi:hypothetical protein